MSTRFSKLKSSTGGLIYHRVVSYSRLLGLTDESKYSSNVRLKLRLRCVVSDKDHGHVCVFAALLAISGMPGARVPRHPTTTVRPSQEAHMTIDAC